MLDRFRFRHLPKPSFLRLTLLSMGLLDELIVGFEVVGLPLLRDQLGLSYEQVGLLFSVAALSGLLFEPFLNLLSDRGSKRWWILGGLVGLALGFALAGSTLNYIVLLVAFALTYPCGIAVDLSQAALIDSAPEAAARTMTRWTLMCSIGDFLSPLAVAAFVAAGLGWSALCWCATAVWLVAAVIIWLQRFPAAPTGFKKQNAVASRDGLQSVIPAQPGQESTIPTQPGQELTAPNRVGIKSDVFIPQGQQQAIPDNIETERDEDDEEISLLAGLRAALRDPVLLRWAALAILPTMLDEVFIGFAALYLKDVLHASQIVISGCILIFMLGAFPGLLVVDRLVGRVAPRKLLLWMSLLTLIGVVGFLGFPSLAGLTSIVGFSSIGLSAGSLFVLGLGAAGLYPVAMAEAYARQPGRSGTVRVVVGLGQPFEILLPGLIGLVASRFGVLAGIGLLGTAPLLILLLLPAYNRNRAKSPSS